MGENMVTVNDLAVELNVSSRTIFNWVQQRKLPPRIHQPGIKPYWPRDVIDGWTKDFQITPEGARVAEKSGGSPSARRYFINCAELAAQHGVAAATIRSASELGALPGGELGEDGTLRWEDEAIQNLQRAHSGFSKLRNWLREYETQCRQDVLSAFAGAGAGWGDNVHPESETSVRIRLVGPFTDRKSGDEIPAGFECGVTESEAQKLVNSGVAEICE